MAPTCDSILVVSFCFSFFILCEVKIVKSIFMTVFSTFSLPRKGVPIYEDGMDLDALQPQFLRDGGTSASTTGDS